jgi:hypothetical protein
MSTPCTNCCYIIVKIPKSTNDNYIKGEYILLDPPIIGDKVYYFNNEQEAINELNNLNTLSIYENFTLSIRKLSDNCLDC